jgi:TPR repeat protein
VGFNLKKGNGIAADEAKAKDFFRRACAADNGAGCAEVGEAAKACKLGSRHLATSFVQLAIGRLVRAAVRRAKRKQPRERPRRTCPVFLANA